jgi:hypothetical protein
MVKNNYTSVYTACSLADRVLQSGFFIFLSLRNGQRRFIKTKLVVNLDFSNFSHTFCYIDKHNSSINFVLVSASKRGILNVFPKSKGYQLRSHAHVVIIAHFRDQFFTKLYANRTLLEPGGFESIWLMWLEILYTFQTMSENFNYWRILSEKLLIWYIFIN